MKYIESFYSKILANVSSDVQIGAGASAKVFKGVDRATQQPVAIKSIVCSAFFIVDNFVVLTCFPLRFFLSFYFFFRDVKTVVNKQQRMRNRART